ncbi:MAG: hypothetical protein ACRC0J_12185 [Shewanella oncorhynchi]
MKRVQADQVKKGMMVITGDGTYKALAVLVSHEGVNIYLAGTVSRVSFRRNSEVLISG